MDGEMCWKFIYLLCVCMRRLSVNGDVDQTQSSLPSVTDDGEFYVVELSSMCLNKNTSKRNYEAVRLHLKLRYFIGRQQLLNSRMKIGFVSFDVCNDPNLLMKVLSNIYLDRRFKRYPRNHISTGNNCCSHSTNVISVVSFMPASMTLSTSDILAINEIPYFAYSYADNTTLTVRRENKYFYSSEILMNSDLLQIEDYVVRYNFGHIAMVNVKSGPESLSSLHRDRLWELLVKHQNLCIDVKDINGRNTTEIRSYIDHLRKDESIRMIIIWSKRKHREGLVHIASDILNRVWFWYSENSFRFENTFDYHINPYAASHHVFVMHPLFRYQRLNVQFSYANLRKKIKESTYRQILEDPWIQHFIQEHKLNKSDPKLFAVFDENKGVVGEHVEALLTTLWWSQPFRVLSRKPMITLWNKIRRLTMIRCCRHVFVKSTNQTRLSCKTSDIHALLKAVSSYNKACHARKCSPGLHPSKVVFNIRGYVKVFGWRCIFCPQHYVKPNYSNHNCRRCSGIATANADRTMCYDPFKDVYLSFSDVKVVVIFLAILPFVAFNLLALSVFCKYHDTPIILSHGGKSSILQLQAHLCLYIAIALVFFGKLSSTKCLSQVFVSGILFTLILSLTLMKTQKVLFAFRCKSGLNSTEINIIKAVEIFASVLVVMIQCVMCIVLYTEAVGNIEVDLSIRDVTRIIKCRNERYFRYQFTYYLMLCTLCSIQAFRTRNLPKYFSGAKEIIYSMYITALIIIVRFPLAASDNIKDQNFLSAVICLLINTMQLCIRYSHTVYTVLFRKEKNSKQIFER